VPQPLQAFIDTVMLPFDFLSYPGRPAPVLVPPSGVLPNVERSVTRRPLKMAEHIHIAKSSTPGSMRRHTVSSRPAARHQTITRPTTVAQRMAPTLTVISAAAEATRHDETGFDSFYRSSERQKEAKQTERASTAFSVGLQCAIASGLGTIGEPIIEINQAHNCCGGIIVFQFFRRHAHLCRALAKMN
jgi:hypothetical protein